MSQLVSRHGLQVANVIADFVEKEALPGTGVSADGFWAAYAKTLSELAPTNKALLQKRDSLQEKIDLWHETNKAKPHDAAAYRAFLEEIGYLVPQGGDFAITTSGVDPEIASIAGPQLVVPVMNARFALNAANARWGSLYDALYGTDAIAQTGDLAPTKGFNPKRGAAVVEKAAVLLDAHLPLEKGSHKGARGYAYEDGRIIVTLADGSETSLKDENQFQGHANHGGTACLLFRHNGLHIELQFDPSHPIGSQSPSGLKDVVLEAALTTIQDCEDSVAAVDAIDKRDVYRNWLGLMQGTLTATFKKSGKTLERTLETDRDYTAPDGTPFTLPGRSVMLVRNVGHLMTTDAILDADGKETPEGIMDGFITSLCAIHDLKKTEGPRNSRTGSVYIVKPKMHGPEEVAFTNTLFDRIEDALGLARNTLKVGVMDEERRTSVNLKECIRQVKDRIVFINTGFLDRTGDEIHTSMRAGVVLPKAEIKNAVWLQAYEDNNVDVGLRAGLKGKAQIGKGMWPKPDDMAEMLATKAGHLKAGGNTAWVPSPTAAVLHALHYHEISVPARQDELLSRTPADLGKILTPPLLAGRNLSDEEIRFELDNNCQSILGYVVRWVEQGIGCSKVPDINNVALMEDRATLRISAQHLANWLHHGIASREQVEDALRRMAIAVDKQNENDPHYQAMVPDYEKSHAFRAAQELIYEGVREPNGYTEPSLHKWRRMAKSDS